MHFFKKLRSEQRKKQKPPAGFDISFEDVIVEYKLTEEDLVKLGELTQQRRSGIASAQLSHRVWYRRSQMDELFPGRRDPDAQSS